MFCCPVMSPVQITRVTKVYFFNNVFQEIVSPKKIAKILPIDLIDFNGGIFVIFCIS